MKICIYGNSHVAALKLAVEEVNLKHPNIEIDFWAIKQRHLDFFNMSHDGVLSLSHALQKRNKRKWRKIRRMANSINGRRVLDLREYDIILRVGLDDGKEKIRELLAGYDVGTKKTDRQLISPDFFSSICTTHVESQLPLQEWQYPSNARHFAMVCPYWSETVLMDTSDSYNLLKQFVQQSGRVDLMKIYEQSVKNRLKSIGVTLIPQPSETLTSDLLSKETYSVDSRKITNLDDQDNKGDFAHLNSKYGYLCLMKLLRAVEGPGLKRRA